MQLDYRMPSARLAPAISIVGLVHGLDGAVRDTIPALLPNLHIRLRGTSRYAFGDGSWQAAPAVAIIGATSAAFGMEMSGDFAMLCAGFLPDGWRDLVGIPSDLLADQILDAAIVWRPAEVEALRDTIAAAPDFAAQQDVVEAFLLRQARDRPGNDMRRVHAVRQWLEQPGALSLDGLVDRLALSPRQIARLTLDSFGASPKTLAMKYRALRAAGSLTVHGHAAMPQAIERYADQSHLIRDFHRFVGWSPGHFLAERQPLARATMLGRWQAGARAPMVLCS